MGSLFAYGARTGSGIRPDTLLSLIHILETRRLPGVWYLAYECARARFKVRGFSWANV